MVLGPRLCKAWKSANVCWHLSYNRTGSKFNIKHRNINSTNKKSTSSVDGYHNLPKLFA